MKGLDTNVIIRFLVNDDRKQALTVKTLFLKAEKEGMMFYIPTIVLLEMIYVLESVYEYQRDEILNALESLLLMKILVFENPDLLGKFIQAGKRTKIELEDILIGLSAVEKDCDITLTFDKKAAKSPLFELL